MKVLLAVDDSPYAKHLLDIVCRRHWPRDVEFKLLHVIEPLDLDCYNADEARELSMQVRNLREKNAEKLCAEARLRLEKHCPDARVHFELRHGKAKNEIVASAAEWEANRILIGAHGRSVCPHNRLGSVSQAVAERAHCSVEVIRVTAKSSAAKEANSAAASSTGR